MPPGAAAVDPAPRVRVLYARMEPNGESNGHDQAPAQPKPKAVSFYELLGVEREATDAEIKKAYKKLSLKLHPDKNRDDPDAEAKFAELNKAYTTLLDPVKRIDHNKELAGGDVGWGWNQAAAQERARDYKWNADDLVFNIGAQLNQARQSSDNADWSEHIGRFGKFWLVSVVAIAVLETLVVVTALSIGMPKACAIWAAILGTIMLLGVVVSLKTDDWNFPAGTLLSIVALVALLGGLVASDMLVQAQWIKVWDCDDGSGDGTNPELAACNKAGMYRFRKGTVVDTSQVHRGGSSAKSAICVAPIVPQAWLDSSYSVNQVRSAPLSIRRAPRATAPPC